MRNALLKQHILELENDLMSALIELAASEDVEYAITRLHTIRNMTKNLTSIFEYMHQEKDDDDDVCDI
jgi:hypothetical protein